jgi:hypothetical protein
LRRNHKVAAGQDADQRRHQARLEELGQRLDVIRHAGHDPAGHFAVVVVEPEALEVGEDAHPQREQHTLGGAPGREHLGDHDGPIGDDHRQRDPGDQPQRVLRVREHAAVDPVAHEHRPSERRKAVERHQGERDRELRPPAAEEPAERERAWAPCHLVDGDVGAVVGRR